MTGADFQENMKVIFCGPLGILGNQAADMDSVVCALSGAQLFKTLNPGLEVYPLIQGKRRDLELKKEIPALLQQAGIPPKELIFLDHDAPWPRNINKIILVDHNVPDRPLPPDRVAGLVDHHEDEGKFRDASLRFMEKSGSCASLISALWGNTLPKAQRLLLAGAISLDTGFLNPCWGKTTSRDSFEFKKLIQGLDDRDMAFLKTLQGIKDDVKALSLYEILTRDYKDFPLKQEKIKGGTASIPLSCKAFFNRMQKEPEGLENLILNHGLDFLLVFHSYGEPLCRELSFRAEDPQRAEQLKKALNQFKSLGILPLKRRPVKQNHKFPWYCYSQRDSTLSRKRLCPLLRKALANP